MTLLVQSISKTFGGVEALREVSFTAEPGVVLGLAGPNGAGKTTLFNVISGVVRPDDGSVHLGNARLDRLPVWRIARLGVGRLFQDVRVFPDLSAVENLEVAVAAKRLTGNVARRRHAALECLETLGLREKREHRAGGLSYGEQKLLAIGRLMTASFDVWLLDEPAAGLARPLVDRVVDSVRSFASQGNIVLLVEHELGVLRRACDHLLFFCEGHLIKEGEPNRVLADPAVRSSYLGR